MHIHFEDMNFLKPLRAFTASRSCKKAFKKDEKGAAAVEFAFVGPLFFGLIFFLIQSGYIFWASSTLDDGVRTAARKIRTGQVTDSSITRADFKDMVCDMVSIPKTTCNAKLVLDVDSFDDFSKVTFEAPNDNGELDDDKSNFDTGEGTSIVIVKAYLPMDSMNWIYKLLDSSHSGQFILSSTAAFRNEPF